MARISLSQKQLEITFWCLNDHAKALLDLMDKLSDPTSPTYTLAEFRGEDIEARLLGVSEEYAETVKAERKVNKQLDVMLVGH